MRSRPRSDGRMGRTAGAYVVIDDGILKLYLERGGRSLLTNGEVMPDQLRALIGMAVLVFVMMKVPLANAGSPDEPAPPTAIM